jgi:putative ABC transport system substrate-binding protein
MKRREFIALLGGAAAAWPLAARAQQPERMRRIGVLAALAEDDPQMKAQLAGFWQGLATLGWSEGRDIRIDYRWNARELDQARAGAKDLVGLQADVIFAHGSVSLIALRQETRTIPLVFTLVSEPVSNGFVESLAHPGGNITGFSNLEPSVGAKWVEMLKEISPHMTRTAIMFNPEVSPTSIACSFSGGGCSEVCGGTSCCPSS